MKLDRKSLLPWCLLLSVSGTALAGGPKESRHHEGGHTGNGGGAVICGANAPLILDYYEIAEPRSENTLPLDSLSREEFIRTISSRLVEGALTPNASSAWKGPLLIAAAVETLRKNGAVDSWAETAAWRIRDEAIENDLPKGCRFEQAAISRDNVPFRIRKVTDRLGEGQKRVLELHEALFALADYFGYIVYNGTSASVRKFVRVLLKKDPSAGELQVAWSEFLYPRRRFDRQQDALVDVTPSRIETRLYESTGLYALDLRGRSGEAKKELRGCPAWIGIVPSVGRDSYLYAFSEEGTSNSIREFFLPDATKPMARGTLAVETRSGFYARAFQRDGRTEARLEIGWMSRLPGQVRFFLRTGDQPACPYAPALPSPFAFQGMPRNAVLIADDGSKIPAILAVKRMIDHYESKRRGQPSTYESTVNAARRYFETLPF